jgi:hypothetical protein
MIPNHAMGNNNPNMMDSMKSMMLTMMMVKTTNDSSNQTNVLHMLWSFIALAFIEYIINNGNRIMSFGMLKLQNLFESKLKEVVDSTVITTQDLEKTASIVVDTTVKHLLINALLDYVTNLPNAKHIIFRNSEYFLNTFEVIQINKDIYSQMLEAKNQPKVALVPDPLASRPTTRDGITSQESAKPGSSTTTDHSIELFSYTLNMEDLRAQLDNICKLYMLKLKNKLGNQIFYFNELFLNPVFQPDGTIDYGRTTQDIHFTMKPFYTNRRFTNLFGEEIQRIKKRVDFFQNNKKWYDDKGIPYTLGVLMSGQSGSGKTSTIKCLANELKRHVVNIHLTNTMSRTQLENLFYNDILNVTQNGKTEQYHIPVDQRLFVLEDVDCQCDIVFERTQLSEVETLKEDLENKKKEVAELRAYMMNPNKEKGMIELQKKAIAGSKKQPEQITLSFLLNLLDGVFETPGRVIIMTSNWIDKLDHALIRPGRFDIIANFGMANYKMIFEMMEHHYNCKLDDHYRNIILTFERPFIPPSELGKICFENFNDIDGAVVALSQKYAEFLQKNKEKNITSVVIKGKAPAPATVCEANELAQLANKLISGGKQDSMLGRFAAAAVTTVVNKIAASQLDLDDD